MYAIPNNQVGYGPVVDNQVSISYKTFTHNQDYK